MASRNGLNPAKRGFANGYPRLAGILPLSLDPDYIYRRRPVYRPMEAEIIPYASAETEREVPEFSARLREALKRDGTGKSDVAQIVANGESGSFALPGIRKPRFCPPGENRGALQHGHAPTIRDAPRKIQASQGTESTVSGQNACTSTFSGQSRPHQADVFGQLRIPQNYPRTTPHAPRPQMQGYACIYGQEKTCHG